jgi:hypothetical protein
MLWQQQWSVVDQSIDHPRPLGRTELSPSVVDPLSGVHPFDGDPLRGKRFRTA